MGLPANAVLLDRYRIQKLLGAGGMGRVYLAEDQKLGIQVAIKVLRDILTQDPSSVKRLITEAKTSILLAHPNIVRLHNFEDGEMTKFLVMEYVEGETLDDRISNKGKLTEEETRAIAVEVCRGLEHAHQKKVIHRDMKPGNVMLGKDGCIKISDFGLARLCHDSIARLTSQLSTGTLQYMSPEQLDGEISELSDQYSVGIMLYEMLSGAPPFVTGDLPGQIRNKTPKLIEGLSEEMNRIVQKCIAKDKNKRFADIRELREELDGTAAKRREQTSESDRKLDWLRSGANAALNEGRFADAAGMLQQALTIKPGDPALTESLKRAQDEMAKAQQGFAAGSQDARLRQVDALKTKGNEAMNASRFGDAIAAFQEALNLVPGDAALTKLLNEARAKADQVVKDAERRRGEEAVSKWIGDVLGKTGALVQQSKLHDAEAMLQQALQHYPGHAALQEQISKIRAMIRSSQSTNSQSTSQVQIKNKPRRKWLAWALVGAAVFFILGIIGALVDQTNTPSVLGSWRYTFNYPNGLVKAGQMTIVGSNEQLTLETDSQYMASDMYGISHHNYEHFELSGAYSNLSLSAHGVRGLWQVDGAPQICRPVQLNLTIDSEGSTMNGTFLDQLGQMATVSMQR
jgi:serine/threonine-protein kinase